MAPALSFIVIVTSDRLFGVVSQAQEKTSFLLGTISLYSPETQWRFAFRVCA